MSYDELTAKLVAENRVLAERVDALHKALRAIAIERMGESNFELCRVCKALCDIAYPFQHKEGCLASPNHE